MSSTLLFWLLLVAIVATVSWPIVGYELAERAKSNTKQLWFIPPWVVSAIAWAYLAYTVAYAHDLGSTMKEWAITANYMGLMIGLTTLGGFVVPFDIPDED